MGCLRIFVQIRMNVDDFGSDRYVYLRGDPNRYQIGSVRTLLPEDGESNEAFERRMDDLAREYLSIESTQSVTMNLERRAGSIVRCTIVFSSDPYPLPLAADVRAAGGRFGSVRGARGKI
jgi:hypothetical protein